MSNSTKYIITTVVVISVVCIAQILFSNIVNKKDRIEKYEENDIIHEDRLTAEELDNDNFKVQYQVKGIVNLGQKINIMNSIKKAVEKVERIIAKSNKLNHITEDPEIPNTSKDTKFIKDLYVKVIISDDNIKEDSGELSEDTIGGSNILETKTKGNNIFPVVGSIQLLKSSVLQDLQTTYDENKYPYTSGLNAFYYVFLHELLHVLGIGFLWTDPDFDAELPIESYNRYWLKDINTNPSYVGPELQKYNGLSATVYYYSVFIGKPGELRAMPIENEGLEGTKLWHWEQGSYKEDNKIISKDDRIIDGMKAPGLQNEIMVGWGTDKPPILSTITIANLEDLGYVVNYNEATVETLDKMTGSKPIAAPVEKPYVPESDERVRQRVIAYMEGQNVNITGEGEAEDEVVIQTLVTPVPQTRTQTTIVDNEEIKNDNTLPFSIFSSYLFSYFSCCFLLFLFIIYKIL